MLVKSLDKISKINALDGTEVKEILHPEKDGVEMNFSLAHAELAPHSKSLKHRIKTGVEIYVILKGNGLMYINEDEQIVKPGDTIYIPAGAVQFIENTGDDTLEFYCMVDGGWSPDCEELC